MPTLCVWCNRVIEDIDGVWYDQDHAPEICPYNPKLEDLIITDLLNIAQITVSWYSDAL